MKEKMTFRPGGYIVINPGLMIKNTTEELCIEVELPDKLTITPLEDTSDDINS